MSSWDTLFHAAFLSHYPNCRRNRQGIFLKQSKQDPQSKPSRIKIPFEMTAEPASGELYGLSSPSASLSTPPMSASMQIDRSLISRGAAASPKLTQA